MQAGLWDGDPDVDAVCRLAYHPKVKFSVSKPYAADKISPFDSQNTFIAREAVPYYMALPGVGRMDDIWASYLLQRLWKGNKGKVVYTPATVIQRRHEQDLISDLEQEMYGYRFSKKFIAASNPLDLLPASSLSAWLAYRAVFENDFCVA